MWAAMDEPMQGEDAVAFQKMIASYDVAAFKASLGVVVAESDDYLLVQALRGTEDHQLFSRLVAMSVLRKDVVRALVRAVFRRAAQEFSAHVLGKTEGPRYYTHVVLAKAARVLPDELPTEGCTEGGPQFASGTSTEYTNAVLLLLREQLLDSDVVLVCSGNKLPTLSRAAFLDYVRCRDLNRRTNVCELVRMLLLGSVSCRVVRHLFKLFVDSATDKKEAHKAACGYASALTVEFKARPSDLYSEYA
jgi:hypothetical protein